MTENSFLLPGDVVPEEFIPQNSRKDKAKPLTLSPGLRFIPPTTIKATAAGSLSADGRKNILWLQDTGRGRYTAATGDRVIVTVHHSSADWWHCEITPHAALAILPQLAFEGASKKTRPQLQPGSLVFARIAIANKDMEAELECVDPSTGKANGLGELKGGMVFEITLGMANRLMLNKQRADGGVSVLEELGEKGLHFEIAVGKNGVLWVNSDNVKTTLGIGHAIQDTDNQRLTLEEQSKLVKKLLKTLQ